MGGQESLLSIRINKSSHANIARTNNKLTAWVRIEILMDK